MPACCTRKPFLSLLAVFAVSTSAAAQVATLRPVDEGARDDSFYAFRAQLLAAVVRRDVPSLVAMLDPKIRGSFGGGETIDDFRALWHITDKKADAELWRVLGSALAFGGAFGPGDNFSAPYVYARWPDAVDPFEHVAIIGSGVRVRAEPSLTGASLRTLSFVIVPLARDGDLPTEELADRWVAVRLLDGRVGYVASEYARSPVDYRAVMSKVSGTWKLSALVAGD